jgi:hypothetical protein
MFMEVLRSTEAQLVAGRKVWRLPEEEKQSSMVCLAHAVLSQLLGPGRCSVARIDASQLRKRFTRVRRHKNPAETLLQHGNARPHTSLKTWEATTRFGLTVAPHPPYSPDLAPPDFNLFGALLYAIRGSRAQTDVDVIRAVTTWLRQQDNAWYQ